MTAPSTINLTFCAQTNVGMVRKGNEDNFLAVDLSRDISWNGVGAEATHPQSIQLGQKGAVFAVSDGMGGAQAGEVASRMAIECVHDFMVKLREHQEFAKLDFYEQLRVAIELANSEIHLESMGNAEFHGMGATFTAVAISGDAAFFAQVGDSRAHLIRHDHITRVTKDQSVVQQLIDLGEITEEEAETHSRRNIILQALGATNDVNVVVNTLPLRADDVILLCSDGLSGKVTAGEMADIVRQATGLDAACQKLIDLANERGGEDNITVMLVKVDGEALQVPGDDEIAPEFLERSAEVPDDVWSADYGLSPPRVETSQESFTPTLLEDPPSEAPPLTTQHHYEVSGRKFVIGFVALALILSIGAVALNKYFVGDRAVLQQKLHDDNLILIGSLRTRIDALRKRENPPPEMLAQLDVLSKRLDEAAGMDATKYQQVGQALSEVENAVYLIERKTQ